MIFHVGLSKKTSTDDYCEKVIELLLERRFPLFVWLEAAQAHPGHSPLVPHEITPLAETKRSGCLVVSPDAPGRPNNSVFTGTSTFLATGEDTGDSFRY
jgi:hypothetical protein